MGLHTMRKENNNEDDDDDDDDDDNTNKYIACFMPYQWLCIIQM